MKDVKIVLAEGVEMPSYATNGSVGLDLRAESIKALYTGVKSIEGERFEKIQTSFKEKGKIFLRPFERCLIGTGIYMEIPVGTEGQVRPKSGNSLKRGLDIALGTIDHDYRGEVGVILTNMTPFCSAIEYKEKIAQIVFNEVQKPKMKKVDKLSETERGFGGFGSTGKH